MKVIEQYVIVVLRSVTYCWKGFGRLCAHDQRTPPRTLRCGARLEGCHFLSIRTMRRLVLATSEAAHQRELASMMDSVTHDPRFHRMSRMVIGLPKKRNRPIEIRGREVANPSDRLMTDSFVSRSQCFDGARTFDVRRFCVPLMNSRARSTMKLM